MTLVQETASGGLTLQRVLQDIPHDAGAIVIYVLMAAFVGFIWYGSRSKPQRTDAGAGQHDTER